MNEFPYAIFTGRYETASEEDRATVRQIFGGNRTEENYRLYFYWFNVIHELGHALVCLYFRGDRIGPEEEMLVSRFAAAFWAQCGQKERLHALSEIVDEILPRFRRPAPEGMDFMAFVRAHWGTETLFNFNNYGWFQFNCVRRCLDGAPRLEDVLAEMGVPLRQPLTAAALDARADGPEAAPHNLRAAIVRLREWGVDVPDIAHIFSDDPNRHCLAPLAE